MFDEQDSQWRVRLAVVDTLPAYATHLGMDIFNARLKDVQVHTPLPGAGA